MTDRRFPNENPSGEIAPSDQEWIAAIRSELGPSKRSPAERAAFRIRLDERIGSRRRVAWQPWAMTTGAAVAAALLWFAMPGSQSENMNRPDEPLVATGAPGLLSYAYYETDYLASRENGNEFLSDEYQAIANVFDVP